MSTMNPSRQITAGYVLALSIVAVLAIAVHVILDRVIASQSDMAMLINVAGQQRTLTQQTALHAARYASGDAAERTALAESADQLLRRHQSLTAGRFQLESGANAEQLNALYFGSPDNLDSRLRGFVQNARLVAQLPPEEASSTVALEMLIDASQGELMAGLNSAVDLYAAESEDRIGGLRTAQRMVLGVIILTLICEGLFIFRPLARRMKDYSEKLYELANRDSLTGCANRRYFMELANDEVLKSRRYHRPLAFLMLDIDKFKSINDTYGHSVGDEAIRALVRTCQNHLRRVDHMGRLGGEEFAIMLPETNIEGAMIVADKLRRRIAEHVVEYADVKLSYTVSMGATELQADPRQTLEVIMNEADEALYAAKNGGRNQVIAYSGPVKAVEEDGASNENSAAAATA